MSHRISLLLALVLRGKRMTLKDFMERYGPTVAVLTLLGVLAVLLPGNANNGDSDLLSSAGSGTISAADGSGTIEGTTEGTIAADAAGEVVATDGSTGGTSGGSTGGTSGGTSGGTAAAPGAKSTSGPAAGGPAAAGPAGTPQPGAAAVVTKAGVKFGAGANCRDDGRQKSFSYAAPTCAEWAPGTPNGGVTDKGVTPDKILVIRYRAPENAATSAALTGAGATDSRENTEKQYQAFTEFFNQHYETYGREVVMKVFDGSGTTDESQRSDAIKIAENLGAFAVLNAGTVGADELARRGVICICTVSLSRAFYNALPPYIFSSLPTSETYSIHTAEYIGKRLAGDKANHAGQTGTFRTKVREFGHIWYEGENGRADPIRKIGNDFFQEELAKYNVQLKAQFSYIFDIAKAPDQSDAMIAKMKNEGVTTISLAVDPLYPIFITQAASKAAYYPEWLILGTALTDTTFFGRTYDKTQMQAAFGISPLYVSWADFRSSPGWKEYHSGDPTANEGDADGKVAVNVNRAAVATLFSGIQMGGPDLDQDSFSKGLIDLPAVGGSPARPLIKFTRLDPTAIKDFNEIYWDSTFQGKDEVNKEGAGAFLHVDGGKRFQAGQWPKTPPKVFNPEGTIFTSDNPPGGPQSTPHDADKHKHDPAKRCLSCP